MRSVDSQPEKLSGQIINQRDQIVLLRCCAGANRSRLLEFYRKRLLLCSLRLGSGTEFTWGVQHVGLRRARPDAAKRQLSGFRCLES